MIPLEPWEELKRQRCFSMSDSTETFKVVGIVNSSCFSDPLYEWQLFRFLCLSSEGGYVLAKEMHQFPADGCSSVPLDRESFFSCDLIDLTREESDQYRSLLKHIYEDPQFQRPPLIL